MNWTLAAIASDKALNATTFQVTLTAPTASFESDVSLWGASILDPAAVPSQGKNFADVAKFVGSGPFYVSSWSQGSKIVLTRNPYYWQKDSCGNALPYLKQVTMEYIADDNSRETALEGHLIDAMDAVPYNTIATLKAQSGVEATASPEAGVVTYPINLATVPALKNYDVVHALNYALDRASIIKVAYSGYAVAATSPIDYGVNFFTSAYGYPYDLAKAKALMKESPYAKGFSFTVLVPSGNTTAAETAQIAQSDWAEIGVKLSIQQIDNTTMFDQFSEGKFQAVTLQGTAQNLDPSSNALYTSVYNGGADSSHTGWDNAQANKLFYESQTALNVAARGALYRKWQQIVMEDSPVIWVVYPDNAYAYLSDVHQFSPQVTVNWDLAQVWMS